MADASTPLWFIACVIGLWLGFRLSHSMHEGAVDSRAPNIARLLVTTYCMSITAILIEVALLTGLSKVLSVSVIAIALTTSVMQLLQIWTEKPVPGKDCQGRDIVE
ncbi:MAG: hypothetical protein VW779_06300 [Halieaceae bacterium]|jgi:hypothetical protein